MVTVLNRKISTIKQGIETWFEEESVVHTDEWRIYAGALKEDYVHKTVCHKKKLC